MQSADPQMVESFSGEKTLPAPRFEPATIRLAFADV